MLTFCVCLLAVALSSYLALMLNATTTESTTTSKIPSMADRPCQWKSGDSYHFPLPKPEGDSFEILFKHLCERDKSQCSAWRDEVNYLLIFAGLLSAVVTAFVIETYKTLSPDPNNTIINLLTIIGAGQVPGGSNSTNGPMLLPVKDPYQHNFTAPSAARNFNIFFFISLVLSLSTALCGIVSLQWLTVHENYPNTLSSKDKLALINMRMESFERWKVHELFASFPILIQLALVSFFIGLASFLWTVDRTVAIPIAVLIALTLFFLLITTILPTIQVFLLDCSYLIYDGGEKLPTECPYMSPQAALCRYLIVSSIRVLRLCSVLFYLAILTPVQTSRWLSYMGQCLSLNPDSRLVYYPTFQWLRPSDWNWFRHIAHYLFTINAPPNYCSPFYYYSGSPWNNSFSIDYSQQSSANFNWTSISLKWLNDRQRLFHRSIDKNDSLIPSIVRFTAWPQLFDIFRGIQGALKTSARTEGFFAAAISCIKTLPAHESILYSAKLRSLETSWKFNDSLSTFWTMPREVKDDYNILVFLRSINIVGPESLPPVSGPLVAELNLRLMEYAYNSPATSLREEDTCLAHYSPLTLCDWINAQTSIDIEEELLSQWALNIHAFFKTITKYDKSDKLCDTTLGSSEFQLCLSYFFECLVDRRALESTSKVCLETAATIELIINYLSNINYNDSMNKEISEISTPTDCLFYCASFYFAAIVYPTTNSRNFRWPTIFNLEGLQKSLKMYKQHINVKTFPVLKQDRLLVVGNRLWRQQWRYYDGIFTQRWWERLDAWQPS